MNRTIIVGYDESAEADDALAIARSLAAHEGVTVTLVAAGDEPEDAEKRLEAESRELGDIDLRVRAVGGASAPRALAETAEAEGADLIVIGSTHRGKLGRVLPGSVGERLLQGAPCAVLIAPRGFARREHFGIGEIGVGFDGGEESRQALAAAVALARDLGARLRLIGVDRPIEPHDLIPGELPPIHEDLERELGRALDETTEVEATSEIVPGSPAAALAERGVELDLLVIGSRGYGPVRRTLLGGVSAEVIRTAPCPVMVVPRSASAQPR